MMRRAIRALVVVAIVVGLVVAFRYQRARAQAAIDTSLNVPILMSPAVQPGQDQLLLFKITNISGQPVDVELTLFNDTDGKPLVTTQFPKIAARTTVTHVYRPPAGTVVLEGSTFSAPTSVRALLGPGQAGPVSAGDPGAIRRVVASLQMVNLPTAPAKPAPQPVESPMLVPLERCLFKPRGMYPYTGATYLWDCSPAT
jgi:hypothetical protein